MKNFLLFLFFSTSVHSTVVGQSNSELFNSIQNLEKLSSFSKTNLATYLINNGFKVQQNEDDKQTFSRDKNDEILLVRRVRDGFDTKLGMFTFLFSTTSKDRYMKVKNSLSVEGYLYRGTMGNMATYGKPSKPNLENVRIVEDKAFVISLHLPDNTQNEQEIANAESSVIATPAKEQSTNQPYNSGFDKSQIVYSGGANHFLNEESVGGKLYLLPDRLYFKSNGFNKQNDEQTILLNQVEQIEFYNPMGLFQNGLIVRTTNGRVEKFVVFGRERWKNEIEKLK